MFPNHFSNLGTPNSSYYKINKAKCKATVQLNNMLQKGHLLKIKITHCCGVSLNYYIVYIVLHLT